MLGSAYEAYCPAVIENGIDGSLLSLMTKDEMIELMQELGITNKVHIRVLVLKNFELMSSKSKLAFENTKPALYSDPERAPTRFRPPGLKAHAADPPDGTGERIFELAMDGMVADLEPLLDEWSGNEAVLNWRYPYDGGPSPLIVACRDNRVDCVRALVNTAGVQINQSNDEGQTGLFYAAFWGRPEVIAVLLTVRGLDIDKAQTGDWGGYKGKTPLMIARIRAVARGEKSYAEVVSLLKAAGAGEAGDDALPHMTTAASPVHIFSVPAHKPDMEGPLRIDALVTAASQLDISGRAQLDIEIASLLSEGADRLSYEELTKLASKLGIDLSYSTTDGARRLRSKFQLCNAVDTIFNASPHLLRLTDTELVAKAKELKIQTEVYGKAAGSESRIKTREELIADIEFKQSKGKGSEAQGRSRPRQTCSFSPSAHYPMYVMQMGDFLSLDSDRGLPPHEEAMARGLLKEVEEYEPGNNLGKYRAWSLTADGSRSVISHTLLHRAKILAVSHQWLRPSRDPSVAHPDSLEGIKFNALTSFLRLHLLQEDEDPNLLLWMDWFSIPQDSARRSEQVQAIKSLPAYFFRASNILVLCVSREAYSDKDRGYISRGHCLLELCTSKLPRLDVFGKWYIPGFEASGLWGKLRVLEMDSGVISAIKWTDFEHAGSPLRGNFTNPDDKEHLRPLVEEYAAVLKSFQETHLDPVRRCATWAEVERATDFFNATSFRHYWGLGPGGDVGGSQDETWSPAEWCESVLPSDYVGMMERSLV